MSEKLHRQPWSWFRNLTRGPGAWLHWWLCAGGYNKLAQVPAWVLRHWRGLRGGLTATQFPSSRGGNVCTCRQALVWNQTLSSIKMMSIKIPSHACNVFGARDSRPVWEALRSGQRCLTSLVCYNCCHLDPSLKKKNGRKRCRGQLLLAEDVHPQ